MNKNRLIQFVLNNSQLVIWGIITLFAAKDSGLSSSQLNFILCFSILIFMIVVHFIKNQNRRYIKNENELVPFNDAIAKEIMRVRSDLIGLQVKQDKRGWDKVPNEFLKMFFKCHPYKSSFLCVSYQAPNNNDGLIILILNDNLHVDDYLDIDFNYETFREINSKRRYQFLKGMEISVFISEPNIDYCMYLRRAKILSVEKEHDDIFDNYYLSLEINLDTRLDDLSWRSKEEIGKNKIYRRVQLLEGGRHFIPDKNWEHEEENEIAAG